MTTRAEGDLHTDTDVGTAVRYNDAHVGVYRGPPSERGAWDRNVLLRF